MSSINTGIQSFIHSNGLLSGDSPKLPHTPKTRIIDDPLAGRIMETMKKTLMGTLSPTLPHLHHNTRPSGLIGFMEAMR